MPQTVDMTIDQKSRAIESKKFGRDTLSMLAS